MAPSFCGIKSFCPLNGYLLKLSDLPDQLLLPSHFNFFFIFLSLEGISYLLVHLVPELSVVLLQLLPRFHCLIRLTLHLFYNFNSLIKLLLQVRRSLIQSHIGRDFHPGSILLILLGLNLLCNNSLLSGQLHFNLLSLNMVH